MISRNRVAILLLVLSAATVGCDKLPLLAPTSSTITLVAGASRLSATGSTELRATVLESSGTPVQNGTVVTFTTTLGRIDLQEARTHSGTATVRLSATGESGIAKITASSGGAKTAELEIKVGSAASKTVILAASPALLASTGGTSDIQAQVEDENGAAVPGAPVTFSTTAGTITPITAITDSSGIAQARLVTNFKADVTATSGTATAKITVDLRPRVGITIQGPASPPAAGLPATITVSVASGSNVTDVSVNFGDGARQSLGALSGSQSISHIYDDPGTYTASAIATEATGEVTRVSTAITILPAQPPGVTITASNSNPSIGEVITLTANVTGAISTIQSFVWDLGGSSAVPPAATTTGNQVRVSWTSTGTKVITVTVNQGAGPSGQGQTAVVVRP